MQFLLNCDEVYGWVCIKYGSEFIKVTQKDVYTGYIYVMINDCDYDYDLDLVDNLGHFISGETLLKFLLNLLY